MRDCFGGTYLDRKVLVTGHTGFKGSWLCLWLHFLGARVYGLALDPDTEPAHWNLLGLDSVHDRRIDLRDAAAVSQAIAEDEPEIVFHLAAQPLVRRSYREPLETFETNVLGLVHLLEAVRASTAVRALVNVTTDKVYLDTPRATGYSENDQLGGHDPYGSSKACAELVSASYRNSYFSGTGGPRMATARAGNVIGGGDWSEDRLIPDLVRAASSGQVLRIRSPEAVRPWQHVLESLSAYLRLGQVLLAGEEAAAAWNFGPAPDATLPVKTVVSRLRAEWPELRVELDPGPHPHEAGVLRLDCSKAEAELGWHPVWNADKTLQRTAQWYRSHHENGLVRSENDLRDYVEDARTSGLIWAA